MTNQSEGKFQSLDTLISNTTLVTWLICWLSFEVELTYSRSRDFLVCFFKMRFPLHIFLVLIMQSFSSPYVNLCSSFFFHSEQTDEST